MPALDSVYQKTRTFALRLTDCKPVPARDAKGRMLLPNAAEGTWIWGSDGKGWKLIEFHILGNLLNADGSEGELYSEEDHAYLINGKMEATHQWLYELLMEFNPES